MHNHSESAENRAYEMHRAAVAGLTVYSGGSTGQIPAADVPAAVLTALGPFTSHQMLLPVLGLALRACQMAAQATGTSVEAVIQQLGHEAATFEG